jgi:hypothetical protein
MAGARRQRRGRCGDSWNRAPVRPLLLARLRPGELAGASELPPRTTSFSCRHVHQRHSWSCCERHTGAFPGCGRECHPRPRPHRYRHHHRAASAYAFRTATSPIAGIPIRFLPPSPSPPPYQRSAHALSEFQALDHAVACWSMLVGRSSRFCSAIRWVIGSSKLVHCERWSLVVALMGGHLRRVPSLRALAVAW